MNVTVIGHNLLEQYEAAPVVQRNGSTGDDRRYDTWIAGCGLVSSGPTKRDQEMEDRASEIERCENLLV